MAGAVINEDPENGRNGAFWGVAKQRTLNILQTTMINYSIVMRSVNANLLEINQAKSRINQAKKEGKTPDPKDLELVKTEKQNAFAISQYTDIMTIEKFAKHITSHGSVYSRADISAILYMAVDCMREMLLEGKKIRLATWAISLSSSPLRAQRLRQVYGAEHHQREGSVGAWPAVQEPARRRRIQPRGKPQRSGSRYQGD